jgi:hypothetical protein
MLVLKHMNINGKLEKLQCTFPKLTEVNQHYMLGLAEGLKRALKRAQNNRFLNSQHGAKPSLGKQTGEHGGK